MGQGRGNGSSNQDDVANPENHVSLVQAVQMETCENLQTNQREIENRLVSAQVTIRDEPTQEGSDINPESIEVTDCKRSLHTTPKSTGDTISFVCGRDGTSGRARWKSGTNVISPHGDRRCNRHGTI